MPFGYMQSLFQKKRLSQVFLRDISSVSDYLDLADFSGKTVLEIGAGTGVVTEYLAARAKRVVAIEIDPEAIGALKQRTAGMKNVEVVAADALRASLDYPVVVGFLPYHISTPLLVRLLHSDYGDAILCLQKEFALRMVAPPDDVEYSRLSVLAQSLADVEFLGVVPAGAFVPVPKVDSALVYLHRNPKFSLDDALVSALFQHKNQSVKNAVGHSARALGIDKPAAKALAASLPLNDRKVRSLTLEELETLSKAFQAASAV
ncbi:MAG: 16S rRNA (adenine(1518)-N(6)/adenine(1519)-N(6))-dimethyltransferase RsmA [Candidatus Micrarchaeota archaeon]